MRFANLAPLVALTALGCAVGRPSLEGPRWVLRDAEQAGSPVDLTGRPPVWFQIEDSLLVASDGCNEGKGRYGLKGSMVQPIDVYWTVTACPDRNEFRPSHFSVPFEWRLDGRRLVVSAGDDVYTYEAKR